MVINLTFRSAKRMTRQVLAIMPQTILNAIAAFSKGVLGRVSSRTLSSPVRTYQGPVRLGMESITENGIMIPENIGNSRYERIVEFLEVFFHIILGVNMCKMAGGKTPHRYSRQISRRHDPIIPLVFFEIH